MHRYSVTYLDLILASSEKICEDVDGLQTTANCGVGASCSGEGIGYTCVCDLGYWGVSISNAPANCTGIFLETSCSTDRHCVLFPFLDFRKDLR